MIVFVSGSSKLKKLTEEMKQCLDEHMSKIGRSEKYESLNYIVMRYSIFAIYWCTSQVCLIGDKK